MNNPSVSVSTNARSKDFTLNVDRTIAKQLQATKRDTCVEYTETGGGIRGVVDAVTFELIKRALEKFYENNPVDRGTVHIDRDIDQKDRTVALIIRVSDESCHAYTLCVYFTKCSFLANGKKVEKLMKSDLPAIHELLNSVVLNGKSIDLKKLNQLLETQLTLLLSGGNDAAVKSANSQLRSNVSPGKKSYCFKCTRPVKSKAIYCDEGGHWTHYHCERLSKEEIKSREKESNQVAYCCKICAESKQSDNTNVKQVASIVHNKDTESIVNQNGQIMLPKLPHYSSPNKILVEEVTAHCPVCDKSIENDDTTCSQCDMACHEHCAIKDTNGDHICYCCDSANDQIDFMNNMNELSESNEGMEDISTHQTQEGAGTGSFRPWVVSPLSRFARGLFRPGSFRPGSFRP